MVTIPVFTRLRANGNRYRMPSGRIAQIVGAPQLRDGHSVVTLRYEDDGEELDVDKGWFNANGMPA